MNEIIKQTMSRVSRDEFYANKKHNCNLIGIAYTGDLSDMPDGYYQFVYDSNVLSIMIETNVKCTIYATSDTWDSILKIIF